MSEDELSRELRASALQEVAYFASRLSHELDDDDDDDAPRRVASALDDDRDARAAATLLGQLAEHDLDADGGALDIAQRLVDILRDIYDGAALGAYARSTGALTALVGLVDARRPQLAQEVLIVIANLCSRDFDNRAMRTATELLACGAARPLLECLETDDEELLCATCGALQNLCPSPSWATAVIALGGQRRLETLVGHSDTAVARYASGAITNILISVHENPSAVKVGILPMSLDALTLVADRAAQAKATSQLRQRALDIIRDGAMPLIERARGRVRVEALRRDRAQRRIAEAIRWHLFRKRVERATQQRLMAKLAAVAPRSLDRVALDPSTNQAEAGWVHAEDGSVAAGREDFLAEPWSNVDLVEGSVEQLVVAAERARDGTSNAAAEEPAYARVDDSEEHKEYDEHDEPAGECVDNSEEQEETEERANERFDNSEAHEEPEGTGDDDVGGAPPRIDAGARLSETDEEAEVGEGCAVDADTLAPPPAASALASLMRKTLMIARPETKLPWMRPPGPPPPPRPVIKLDEIDKLRSELQTLGSSAAVCGVGSHRTVGAEEHDSADKASAAEASEANAAKAASLAEFARVTSVVNRAKNGLKSMLAETRARAEAAKAIAMEAEVEPTRDDEAAAEEAPILIVEVGPPAKARQPPAPAPPRTERAPRVRGDRPLRRPPPPPLVTRSTPALRVPVPLGIESLFREIGASLPRVVYPARDYSAYARQPALNTSTVSEPAFSVSAGPKRPSRASRVPRPPPERKLGTALPPSRPGSARRFRRQAQPDAASFTVATRATKQREYESLAYAGQLAQRHSAPSSRSQLSTGGRNSIPRGY